MAMPITYRMAVYEIEHSEDLEYTRQQIMGIKGVEGVGFDAVDYEHEHAVAIVTADLGLLELQEAMEQAEVCF